MDGGWRWQASPMQNTRPEEYSRADMWLLDQTDVERIVIGTVSSPMSSCAIRVANASSTSGGGPEMS